MSPLCELVWEGALVGKPASGAFLRPAVPGALSGGPPSGQAAGMLADSEFTCVLPRLSSLSFLTLTLLSLSLKEHTRVPPELLALCASVHLAVGIAPGPQPTTPTAFAGPEPENLSRFPNTYGISLLGTTHRRV